MVSVVLPTCNRQKLLAAALQALESQRGAPDFEIIIVNDGSTDNTREYLDAQNDDQIRVINHDSRRGKSQARNSGIRAARGDIIAFTDDDMVVENFWLKELIQPFSTSSVVCAYGETIYAGDGQRHYFPERIVANPHARFPMAGNIAYRRWVFDLTGLFDPAFDKYSNEDTEFACRAATAGRFAAVPSARAIHSRDFWTAKKLLKSAKNASVWPILYKRHGANMSRGQFMTPIRYHIAYPIDLLLLIFFLPLLPFLLARYSYHGQRDWKIFFAKWPLLIMARRFSIWREAIRHHVAVF